jgi:peptidoglycan/xylan/chitin deacetylase (PgdA/CDA1 family)
MVRPYPILPFYHAVTDNPPAHIKHLGYYRLLPDFKSDINFLLKYFEPIDIFSIEKNISIGFHLSFDDGLSECYSHILPILLENKLKATFFINSAFVDNKKMFVRHKVGLILDYLYGNYQRVEKLAKFFKVDRKDLFKTVENIYNDSMANEVLSFCKIDIAKYLAEQKPYLTTRQLHELKDAGMVIGAHGYEHLDFSTLTFDNQVQQIIAGNHFLESVLGVNDLLFAFPYGSDRVSMDFFHFLYNDVSVVKSFGIAGMKSDSISRHFHRIAMEYKGVTAEQIFKFEYFYYLLKSPFRKNNIKR